MKHILLLTVFCISVFCVEAQELKEATFTYKYRRKSSHNKINDLSYFIAEKSGEMQFSGRDSAYMSAVKFKISKEGKVVNIRFARNATDKFKSSFTMLLKASEQYWTPRKINGVAVESQSYVYIYRDLTRQKKKIENVSFPSDTRYMDAFKEDSNEFCILIPWEMMRIHGPIADID